MPDIDSHSLASVVRIETPRLILRTVTLADAPAVASSWKLDEAPISLARAEDRIHWMLSNHAQIKPGKIVHLCLAIVVKDTNEFAGWCGLDHTIPGDADPALFYLLKEKYWGKGLATEAARALLDYAFNELALPSIHGGAEIENLASKRVMEKLGMRYVGLDAEGNYAFISTCYEYLNTGNTRP